MVTLTKALCKKWIKAFRNRQNFKQIAKYIEAEILPECPDE